MVTIGKTKGTIHEITRNKLNLTSSSCLLRVSSWIVLVFQYPA